MTAACTPMPSVSLIVRASCVSVTSPLTATLTPPIVRDPPLATTVVDASGLFIYLSIAKLTVSALAGH